MRTKRTNRLLALLLTLMMVVGLFPMTAMAEGDASVTLTVDAEGFGTVSSATMYYHLYPNVGFTFDSRTGQFTTDLTDIDNQNQSAYTEITATPSGKTVSATLTGATGTYYLVVVAKDNTGRYAIFGFQATSTDGITFTGTGGAQQTGSVNGNPAGGGNFAFVSPKITTVVSPAGAGTVTGGGYYAYNATAQLKATANSGYTFKHWLKDGSTNVGSETTINVGVTQNATYTAVFEPTYLVSVSGTGITANPASQSVVSGGTASFALTPSGDYYFPNPLSCATAGGVTVTRLSDTSATLTVQSVTSLMNLNVTGAVRYLGKIGDTYYTDQAALLEAMKNATANTQIVLGSTFSTSAPIQMNAGVKVQNYGSTSWTTTTASSLYSVAGGALTVTPADAKIGDTLYANLADALAAAQDGETVQILKTAANDPIFGADKSYTLKENVTLSYQTQYGTSRSVTAVGGDATVSLLGQSTILDAGSLKCTGSVGVKDEQQPYRQIHTVYSNQEITVTAGSADGSVTGMVSGVKNGQKVLIDSVTYTAAADDTSFPLTGRELTLGETAEIVAGDAATVTVPNDVEVTSKATNTGAAAVVPKGEGDDTYTEVTLGKTGDTVEIGQEGQKNSYTANKDNTTLVVDNAGNVTLKDGEVSLEDGQSIGVTTESGTVTITNPTEEPAVDGDKVIVKGGDADYAGYVTVKDGGNVQIGNNEPYTAPENTEVVYAIEKDGTVKEVSRTTTLTDGQNTTIFEDNSAYIENVNNSGDNDEISVGIEENTAAITVPSGKNHQVAIGAGEDSKVIYTNGSGDKEMVLQVAKGETVPTLSKGSVTVPAGEEVKVGETTYTAPADAEMTISVDENGKAVLTDGKAELDKDEAIIAGVSGKEIINTSGTELIVENSSGITDKITIPVGGSVTIDGVKYENKGEDSATLKIDSSGKITVTDGTIQVTPKDNETAAEVTVDGAPSAVVSGKEPFTVTAGTPDDPGTAVAKPGQTLTIDDMEYTANPNGNDTIFDLGDPGASMQPGDTATFPSFPEGDPNDTVNRFDIEFGTNTFNVPELTYDGDGNRTGGNSGSVSVVKGEEEGSAAVTIEKAGDKAIINDEEYTATADNTVLDVAPDGNVTLTGGGVELDNGKDITVNGKDVSATEGTEPATITRNEDGSATIEIPEGTKVTVGDEALEGEAVYKIDENGNVTLISKTTYLKDGNDTTANGITVANPADPSGDRISVKQEEGAPAIVTVPKGTGNEVVLTDGGSNEIRYTNPSATDDMVLEIDENGNIKLTDGGVQFGKDGSIVAAPEGGTETLVKNTSEGDVDITVETDDTDGTTKVTVPGAGSVTIGEGENAKTFTAASDSEMELTVDENGKISLTGGGVALKKGESITANGATYTAKGDAGVTVKIDPNTGKVTVEGDVEPIVIDEDKFNDSNFKFEMLPGVPVQVGDYVYKTDNEGVTLSGRDDANGYPTVNLPAEDDVMKVSLAKDETKFTNYTAVGENTKFAMSGPGNTANVDLLGQTADTSGLTFTGTDPVTVDGITYAGDTDNDTYKVLYGDAGNRVVLPNNDTKVTATFTGSDKTLATGVNQVNGQNVVEDGTAANLPFGSVTAPSSIVIEKGADGKVNVTNGSKSALEATKDANGNITGYEVKKTSSGGSSSGMKVIKLENGTVEVDRFYASAGQTVTITTKPDEGYKLSSLTVTDSKGNPVELKDLGGGKYSFVQPENAPVTVSAIFVKEGECNRDETCPAYHFTDLNLNEWYHDGVHYCLENGLLNGTGDTTFSPHTSTSRGMIVTMLYRLEGSPAVSNTNPFEDVAADKYYTNAIIWAEKNGIVGGYGENKFGPDDAITREQMAAILYRYAEYKGYDVTGRADLSKFTDNSEISNWAETALSWANANSLVEGDGNKLMPTGNAERCQVAAILHRFCENVVK